MYQDLMKQELEVSEKLDHPHIVRVLDLAEDMNNIYMALELIEHGNLLEVLDSISRKRTDFTESDAAHLIYQIFTSALTLYLPLEPISHHLM